jgi:hypothetical protein
LEMGVSHINDVNIGDVVSFESIPLEVNA